jgi:hypothetical protein
MAFVVDTATLPLDPGIGPAPYSAGVAPGPVRPADPATKYVVARPGAGGYGYDPGVGIALARQVDDLVARWGLRIYDWMRTDPQVHASLATLKLGIMGSGLQLAPAVEARPRARPSAPGMGPVPDPAEYDPGSDDPDPADVRLARELAEFCKRSVDRLARPVLESVYELLDAVAYGSALAEVTYRLADDGPDAGRLVLDSLRPLPRTAWAWVVDAHNDVLGILADTLAGPAVLPRAKFCGLSWGPRGGDPRGQSVLRSAYVPWNLKQRLQPERAKWIAQFADPSLVFKYGTLPNVVYAQRADGTDDPARELTPVEQCELLAARFASGSWLAMPDDWQVDLVHSKGDDHAFDACEESLDRQITKSILLATRATNEAQYGSRADSNTAMDILGLAFEFGRRLLAAMVEDDLFYPLIARNWGRDVADRLTPRVSFGTNKYIQAQLWTAFAAICRAGVVPRSILPRCFEMLGIPVPAASDFDDAHVDSPAEAGDVPGEGGESAADPTAEGIALPTVTVGRTPAQIEQDQDKQAA